MGTTLTGTTPQDTYDSLIKVTDNGPLSGSLKVLTDGLGNNSALSLSTTAASIAGTLAVTGAVTTSANINLANTFSLAGRDAANTINISLISRNSSNRVVIDPDGYGTTIGGGGTVLLNATGGNVGIGTSAPDDTLHLNKSGAALYNATHYTNSNSTANFFVGIGGSAVANSALQNNAYVYNAGASAIVFGTSDTERMRISSAGLVGIGKTSPTNPLHILKAESSVLLGGLKIERDPNTSTSAIFNAFGGAAFIVANSGVTSSFTSPIVFAVSDNTTTTEIARITSSGLTFNGDSAAANALDDYEEGTWTMGVSFGGASVGVTTNLNTGAYTKVGNKVTVTGFLQLSSKGSSTGVAKITGLPFTLPANLNRLSAPSLWFNNITFANQFQGYCDQNSTNIDLYEITEAGVATGLTNADFANNSEIMLSATYFV